jgi:hypothetical protein
VETHALLRTYLRVELETLISFFREYPGCIPPKIQLIFAVLRLARDEVMWYFRHADVVPYKAPRKYQWRPDEYLSHLIYYVGQLQELVAANKRGTSTSSPSHSPLALALALALGCSPPLSALRCAAVQEYYCGFLNGADRNALFPAIDAFQQQNKMTAHTQQLFTSLKDALGKVSEEDNFEVNPPLLFCEKERAVSERWVWCGMSDHSFELVPFERCVRAPIERHSEDGV